MSDYTSAVFSVCEVIWNMADNSTFTTFTISPSSCCNIEPCGVPCESTFPDTGSIPGICYGSDKAVLKCPFSGSGLPFLGISANRFTDFLVVDICHGLQVASACLLARERKSLENNANVFQVCPWQQGDRDY